MKTMTASAIAVAVSMGLCTAAIANEGTGRVTADHKHSTAVELHLGHAEADQLGEQFRRLDTDNDGLVRISELDASERDRLARFDADDDQRLDRYEFEMARIAGFSELDANADGELSRTELEPIRPEWVSFVALDTDNDRSLSEQEYRQFIASGDWVDDTERYAFDYVDRDASGDISNEEAAVYVPLASSFTAYDPDGDGVIERTEYQVFMAEVELDQPRAVAGSGEALPQDEMR
jgi:Ca2+-binding EF-hand superfamily protein